MLRILTTSLGLAALTGATAATPPPLFGVWKGQVGEAPVMACFTASDAEYYYLKRLRGITLVSPGDHAADDKASPVNGYELEEKTGPGYGDTPVTGRWRLRALDGARLSGTWTAPQGNRALPIRLTRVALDPGEQASIAYQCGNAFTAPIAAGIRVRTAPAKFGDHAFEAVATEDATAFQVGDDVPHAEALNRFAKDWLRDQAVLRYDCDKGRGGASGGGTSLGRTLTPVAWSRSLLVLKDVLPDLYCGGAHSSFSITYVTWSLQRGEKVDGWTWIEGGAPRAERPESPKQDFPLRRLLERQHPRNVPDDDCAAAMPQMLVEAPYPTADGLVFNTTFFHAMRACGDEVTLTWKQARPFLSQQGRELMAAFR